MTTNENLIDVPGRLHSVAIEGHVAGADEIYDDTLGKLQSEVNASKADLVNGKVPSEQLPSYVDDVVNGYYYNGSFYKEAAYTTVITGEEGKIYIDIPTDKSYRWSGSAYILISNPYSVDEEDLTVVNNNIKFKDRPNTDGMGKVILRKNIVSGVNTLTQSMINQTNTIYVIQYDYTLASDITIPDNSVLEFDGGSISASGSNDTIAGSNTYIQAGLVKIFNTNINLSGSWSIKKAYCEWFGAKGDGYNDDSDAFYKTLDAFGIINLRVGIYSINWRDILLESKSIIGESRNKSIIKQRNINVPFGFVGDNTYIHNVTFEAKEFSTEDSFVPLNTQVTDILSFGYCPSGRGVSVGYHPFRYMEISSVTFLADANLIPIHFNIQKSGNGGGYINDIVMRMPHTGMWYQFEKNESISKTALQWLTNHVVSNIQIIHPAVYGFRWDAISMNDQGESVPDREGYVYQTMWCYANTFENIRVSITRDQATGFKIGQGMSRLVNPIVFNDVAAHEETSEKTGYSIEFAETPSPKYHKMFTTVEGGLLEGLIKNRDYAYINIFNDTKLTLRQNRTKSDKYDILDLKQVESEIDLNIYGNDFATRLTRSNASIETGIDSFGRYVKVIKSNAGTNVFYARVSYSVAELKTKGLSNGLYTLQYITESNRGSISSGSSPIISDGIKCFIDGEYRETELVRGTKIINNVFIEISDNSSDDDTVTLTVGNTNSESDALSWVKIYGVILTSGIVGKYFMYAPPAINFESIKRSETFTVQDRNLVCSYTFNNITDMLSTQDMPTSFLVRGRLPAITSGSTLSVGSLNSFVIRTALFIQIFDKSTGEHIANCTVSATGDVNIKAITEIADNTQAFGYM